MFLTSGAVVDVIGVFGSYYRLVVSDSQNMGCHSLPPLMHAIKSNVDFILYIVNFSFRNPL